MDEDFSKKYKDLILKLYNDTPKEGKPHLISWMGTLVFHTYTRGSGKEDFLKRCSEIYDLILNTSTDESDER